MSASEYEDLFGPGFVGRPPLEEGPTGVPTGDPKLTELARRRATRVLKAKNREQFEAIMAAEIEHLKTVETT